MKNAQVEEIIQNWVRTLPEPLINNFSERPVVKDLQENLDQTLNPLLSEAGYQAQIKVLSMNFNKIVRLKVEGPAGEENADELEDSSYYCLSFEDLTKFVEPDAGLELAAKRQGEAIISHLAPVYAFNKTANHRVSLLPFYQDGTLDDRVNYTSYFAPAADDSSDSTKYQTLCGLRAIQNHYFLPHKDVGFTAEGMEEASQQRVFSYETINSAMHLYELKEKKAEMQAKPKKSKSPLKKIRSALGRENSSKEVIAAEHQREKKHIDNFFTFLVLSIEAAVADEDACNALIKDLERHFPDKQKKGDFIEKVRAALKDCNEIISDAINSIEFEANLQDIMEAQQEQLVDMSIQVTELFDDLEKSDMQYYDIKGANFFVVDGRLVISDNKSLTQREGDKVEFGLGHMTYKTPQKEFSQMEGSSVDTNWAKGLTKFQIGVLLYDMTVGIPGQHLFSNTSVLLDAGVTKELDFNHPCFETPIGQMLKTQIQALTDLDPAKRPDISQVREALIAFKQEMANYIQEDAALNLPPAPSPLVCPVDIHESQDHLSMKEKIKTFRADEDVVEDAQVKSTL